MSLFFKDLLSILYLLKRQEASQGDFDSVSQ